MNGEALKNDFINKVKEFAEVEFCFTYLDKPLEPILYSSLYIDCNKLQNAKEFFRAFKNDISKKLGIKLRVKAVKQSKTKIIFLGRKNFAYNVKLLRVYH